MLSSITRWALSYDAIIHLIILVVDRPPLEFEIVVNGRVMWVVAVFSHRHVKLSFALLLSIVYIYRILCVFMVGVNHLFIIMKAKKNSKRKSVGSIVFVYIYMFKRQVKKETFQSFYFRWTHLWTIIIVLSYKYSPNETIKSKKQRHELFFPIEQQMY